ncbi:MAG: 4-alpha-glucanotransferase [Phycisphaerae bacterium]|nr:4-alpha-glucanotransferase [Phycisphaerae bacterium]MDW8261581.1 4-alpha-glucanotransferase [Phycisphaerales bacterium]
MKCSAGPFTFARRSSGVLMHITSLPGPHGSGDLGRAARDFVDFLAAAGQSWWQMLPVNPPGDGYSPYSCSSTIAGSPWLISLDSLVREGLLRRHEIEPDRGFRDDRVHFDVVVPWRKQRLRMAYDRFRHRPGAAAALNRFTRLHRDWLDDFALYSALKDAHAGKPWSQWARDLRLREPRALADARRLLADDVRFHQFLQWLFDRQWQALRKYAHARGVGLIGDIPIFIAHDSADVWAHRELFLLDAEGAPRVVSGCPPDYFNPAGQRWGHPHYNWAAHRREGFAWWVRRFAHTFRLFDAVRIDHFLGFYRVWQVPAEREDARVGRWVRTPGRELFNAVRRRLGDAPIIAEDLGAVTDGAIRLREEFGFPGMRVLQFAFGGGREHLPHNQPVRSVLYTGTHDNDTIRGYFDALARAARRNRHARRELERMQRYANTNGDGRTLHWDLIRTAMASPANTTIFPMQDILGLGTESRMNVPGTTEGNWHWRMKPGSLRKEHAQRLRTMCEDFERI